ncbi:hypothetical protein TNCV_1033271 [Trichonephila clavipes]|nr:hypothetical protein TNCV_1033271 [Trichonephila clavipes]
MYRARAGWGHLKYSPSRKYSREVGSRMREGPQNLGGTELKRTVTSMVLKASDNDRRKNYPLATMNIVDLDMTRRSGGISNHTTLPLS